MITKNMLFAQIGELQSYLMHNIPNINEGGCGLFALKISEVLQQFDISHEITIFDDTEEEILYNKSLLDQWNDGIDVEITYTAVSHCAIRCMGYYFDSYENHVRIQVGWADQYCVDTYSFDQMQTAVEYASWNVGYNKELYNDALDVAIKDYIYTPLEYFLSNNITF